MQNIAIVYLNGRFLAPEAAAISPFDRGFIFGDGVYEVIPVFGGRPFRLGPHLARLNNSLAAVGLTNPKSEQEWGAVFDELIRHNGSDDQSIYLQITRGVAARDHAYPIDVTPTVFAYAQRLQPIDEKIREAGINAVTVEDIRWQRCDIKCTALLANVMLRQQAAERGATEAILIRDGELTEGAASNIFVVEKGVLKTPPKGPRLLPGITRDLVLELAARHGVPHQETAIPGAALHSADEVWMTSSTKEIAPITRIDGRAVADGRGGPLFKTLWRHYRDYKQALREGRAQ